MNSAMQKAVSEGFDELAKKSLRQIQVDTAYKWAGRACAAAALSMENPNTDYARDCLEYAHEAIEHAALCGDSSVLQHVRSALATYGVML